MHLSHLMAQSHVECAEIDFKRYYQFSIWLTTHRLQKIDTTKYQYYLIKLNFNFKQYGSFVNHRVDESIIPYYGKHSTEKFIRGKAIRFWFKLWCITSSKGYLLHAEPYCGVDTDLPDTALGQGADAVLDLIEKCEVKVGSAVTFDNLFTSLPLLHELTELGIGARVNLQQNHFHGAPNKTIQAKKPRGSYDFTANGKNLVMSWLYNKITTCATMLPVNLSSKLNGGQNQPKNELIY